MILVTGTKQYLEKINKCKCHQSDSKPNKPACVSLQFLRRLRLFSGNAHIERNPAKIKPSAMTNSIQSMNELLKLTWRCKN